MDHQILQRFAEAEAPAENPGVTPVDAAPEAQSDISAEFESLIKGKYKEQYDTRVQDTVRKRLRSSHETVEKFNALSPALTLLAEHYGIDPANTRAIAKAVEGDDAFYRAQAQKRGVDVQSFKALRALEQENRNLRTAAQHQRQEEFLMRQCAAWKQQAEEAKNTYPDLDMNTECQNPRFRQLLSSGLDVASAYLLVHREAVLEAAAQSGRQMMATHMMVTGNRPSENGTTGASAAVLRTDVASMSRSDRESIRRRAARGERIRL